MGTPLVFHPYHDLQGRPNVIVDGSATAGTVLCLSHWPHTPCPAGCEADLSAEMAFRYLEGFDRHGDAGLVSNNHFDQDGLVSILALVHPEAALPHRELLTDLASAGDFGTYRSRDAARASMAIAAFADPERSPLSGLPSDHQAATAVLYEALLGRAVDLATHPDRYSALWRDEDACLAASERCIRDQVRIEEVPDVDLAIFTVPDAGPGIPGRAATGSPRGGWPGCIPWPCTTPPTGWRWRSSRAGATPSPTATRPGCSSGPGR